MRQWRMGRRRQQRSVPQSMKLIEQKLDVGGNVVGHQNQRSCLLCRLSHALWADAKPEAYDVRAFPRICTGGIDRSAGPFEGDIERSAVAEELRSKACGK